MFVAMYICYLAAMLTFIASWSSWYSLMATAGRVHGQHESASSYFAFIEAQWDNRGNLAEPVKTKFIEAVTAYAEMTAMTRALDERLLIVGGKTSLLTPVLIGLFAFLFYVVSLFFTVPLFTVVLASITMIAFAASCANSLRVLYQIHQVPVVIDATVFNGESERRCLQALITNRTVTVAHLRDGVFLNMSHINIALNDVKNDLRA
jgi:hypothetical protein